MRVSAAGILPRQHVLVLAGRTTDGLASVDHGVAGTSPTSGAGDIDAVEQIHRTGDYGRLMRLVSLDLSQGSAAGMVTCGW